ncbi:MAG TPA: isocitrate lyase [Anaeromyxobacteraceae bacterium]|nr:isocitrate lyase [Anaeromyxobacteraceae bacterium]
MPTAVAPEPTSAAREAPIARAAPPRSPWPAHSDPSRWFGIVRDYRFEEVERLRGTVAVEHTLARLGAERLWELLKARPYVAALGALSGQQAVQMVKGGLESIYLSGWQVAADANTAGQTYPDQSLYPADSVPAAVQRINRALQRADQIAHAEGKDGTHWFAPIVADAEAGFGGPLNAFELMKAMIEAGAAAVHFEDQVAAEKKCGHLGGKVLVPTGAFVRTLNAARLAADVLGVPTLLVARTDAHSANLIMSDVDPADEPFIDRARGRTPEGFFHLRSGLEAAIARGLAYAPYVDLLWCETSTPDLDEAREFARGIHARFPGKMLAYNCSPSFNWKKHLSDDQIARFQRDLGDLGYKFQFVTLAGFHALNYSMFQLASEYRLRGMQAYTELQQAEFAAEARGYTASRHQAEVGTGYFDRVNEVLSAGRASTLALSGSTEAAQFAAADTVGRAQRVIEEDHDRLHQITRRIRQTHDLGQLADALDELNAALVEHFAHEEHPQGLYGILGSRAPEVRRKFAAILAEHARILENVQSLVLRARAAEGDHRTLSEQAALLAHLLGDHEMRESQVARALLAPAA